jgi:hypothetical protein
MNRSGIEEFQVQLVSNLRVAMMLVVEEEILLLEQRGVSFKYYGISILK